MSERLLPPSVDFRDQHSTDGCDSFTLLTPGLNIVGSGKKKEGLLLLRINCPSCRKRP